MRYCKNGICVNEESLILSDISRNSVQILTRTMWNRDGISMIYEYYNKDYAGVIDCSFLKEDLYVVPEEENDWIATLLFGMAKDGEDFDVTLNNDLLEELEGQNLRGVNEESGIEEDVERIIESSDGSMRHFSFGKEHLSQGRLGEYVVVTDEAEGTLRRKLFDSDKKLVRYEQYSVNSDLKNSNKLFVRNYFYNEEGMLTESIQENLDDQTKISCLYNEHKLVSRKQTFHKDGDDYKQDSDTSFEYDDEYNLTLEECKMWFYTKGRNDSVVVKKSSTKKLYKYTDKSSYPDYEFYENNVLRMTTVYESENVYNEKMYFNDGIAVEVRYEDGKKTEEKILFNGVEQRRTHFEK